MGLSMVDEKALGKAAAENLAPYISQAQDRLETWADALLSRLLTGNEFRVSVSLGGKVVNITITARPAPKP